MELNHDQITALLGSLPEGSELAKDYTALLQFRQKYTDLNEPASTETLRHVLIGIDALTLLARQVADGREKDRLIQDVIDGQLKGASQGCGYVVDYVKDILLTRDLKSTTNTVLSSQSLIDNAIKRLTAALAGQKQTCKWTYSNDDCDMWETACGQAHQFMEGNPIDNHHKFCPYCGLPIETEESDGENT
jgi:hypothetical protein